MADTDTNTTTDDAGRDTDTERHGTDTVDLELGMCRYGGADEPATVMAVRKDGTGWIAVCDEHKEQAEQDGFEVREGG